MSDNSYNENAYNGFAYCYDLFMDNIPYDMWAEYLYSILTEYGITEGTLLELGCGTGSMTECMIAKGYDSIIGLDSSEDMLMMAREKNLPGVLLIQQDMRELELPDEVDAVYCVCDGMNYLLEPQDLQRVFTRVKRFLKAGGVFVFDMKTDYFYREILGDRMHYQRAYATELVQSLAEEAGLTCKAVYQAFTREPVKPDNERIYYIFQN